MKIRIWIIFFAAQLIGLAYADTTRYQIDTNQSFIHVFTDRAGPLKKLSHLHIINLSPLSGHISYDPNGEANASFNLLPEQFTVDAPEHTAIYPDVWDEEVKASAARGTRKNMLSKKLLHAEDFPEKNIKIELVEFETESAVFQADITLKEKTFSFELPGSLTIENGIITADVEFNLTHKQLGLKNFKAAGGAIAVGKNIAFKAHIVAQTAGE